MNVSQTKSEIWRFVRKISKTQRILSLYSFDQLANNLKSLSHTTSIFPNEFSSRKVRQCPIRKTTQRKIQIQFQRFYEGKQCKTKFGNNAKPLRCHFADLVLMNTRAKPGQAYIPTNIEHVANVLTHGLLIMPSTLALIWMLELAHTPLQYAMSLVYGCALLALFTISTTFHTISYTGKFRNLKNVFHIGDRAVIYVFIAASYTPWLTLKDLKQWGAQILYVVWFMAILGILYQYLFHERYKGLETLLYLMMGICPAVAVFAMEEYSGVFEMGLGGLVYIAGVVFFKSDGYIPFAHAIWHCFVFIGAFFHWYAVCTYLLGRHNAKLGVSIDNSA